MKKIVILLLVTFVNKSVSQNNTLHFNGVNNDVSFAYNPVLDFSLNDVFTIEAWFRTSNSVNVIYSNLIDTPPFVGHEVGMYNGKIFFCVVNNYITSQIRIETTNTYNDGNWHHVAFVYNGTPNANAVRMYVDGAQQTPVITNNNLNAPANTGNPIKIGSRGSTTYFFSGSIDEVRVWGRALCADEIIANRNCHLTGQEPALFAYHNFNQGIASGNNATVNTLIDQSGNNNNGTLNAFLLTGSTSNWIAATNGITGTCSAFSVPLFINSTNSLVCKGTPITLLVSGAETYNWIPGNKVGSIQTFTPAITTTYSVFASTASGCTATAVFTQEVSPCIGISNEDEKALLIYPNPFTEDVFLENMSGISAVEIIDLSGRSVFQTEVSKAKDKISLPNLESGIYILRLISANAILSKIICKQPK